MKKFRILVTETVGGWTEVEARDEEHAEQVAQEKIDNEGGACIYKTTHREFDVVGMAEEV